MANKTEEISRYIIISLLLAILGFAIHIAHSLVSKEEINEIVTTQIAEQFYIQELKGNIYDSAIK